MHAAGKIFVKTYLKAIRDTVVILKGGDIFYFLMVFNLLKIIHPFESKKHLRT